MGRDRFRLRRDGHRDPEVPAGQPHSPPVPPAGGQGDFEPHGLQQQGRARGRRQPACAALPRRGGHQHRQEQDLRGCRGGLPRHRDASGPACGLPGGQRLFPQHAGSARPAGGGGTPPDPGSGEEIHHHPGVSEDRAGSFRRRHRRRGRPCRGAGLGRHCDYQHDHFPRRAENARLQGGEDGRGRHQRSPVGEPLA